MAPDRTESDLVRLFAAVREYDAAVARGADAAEVLALARRVVDIPDRHLTDAEVLEECESLSDAYRESGLGEPLTFAPKPSTKTKTKTKRRAKGAK